MSRKHLGKILGMAVVAALMISAVAAASASAHTWVIGGTSLSGSNGVEAELKPGTHATLTGTLLGQEFVLDSSHLEAKEGLITQGTNAEDSGKLVFSELTVTKPSGCTVTSPIETKKLKTELVASPTSGSEIAYDKFAPAEGEVFATIKVANCSVAGSYNVKGTTYGEGLPWGKEEVNQPLTFSPAINTLLGGGLTLGSNPATLTAEGQNHLITTNVGAKFGAVK